MRVNDGAEYEDIPRDKVRVENLALSNQTQEPRGAAPPEIGDRAKAFAASLPYHAKPLLVFHRYDGEAEAHGTSEKYKPKHQ